MEEKHNTGKRFAEEQSAVSRTRGIRVGDIFETANLDGDIFLDLVFQIDSAVRGSVVRSIESTTSEALTIRLKLAVPDEPQNYLGGSGRLSIGDLNNDTLDDIALFHKRL